MSAAKVIFFVLWLAVSAGWAVFMAQQLRVGDAIDTYSSYYQKTNDINNGTATSYEKQAYMDSGPALEKAGGHIFLFLMLGIALPFAVLQTGKHLMKPKDPREAAKKR